MKHCLVLSLLACLLSSKVGTTYASYVYDTVYMYNFFATTMHSLVREIHWLDVDILVICQQVPLDRASAYLEHAIKTRLNNIMEIIKREPLLINKMDSKTNLYPLQVAAYYHQTEVLRLLLDKGADIRQLGDQEPHFFCKPERCQLRHAYYSQTPSPIEQCAQLIIDAREKLKANT